jgi:enoyl-CoA hydratase/3-hydroxyacyl-CoA dehydrogenase
MGPFELMNVTGIPIAVHSSTTLGNEIGPFYATADNLKTQMEKNENWDLDGEIDESKLPAVIDRFYGVCLGVAAALVDEGVASIEDTDRGAKIGLRWSMGPFEIMNKIGIDKTYAAVAAIAEKYPGFKMPAILARQHELGKPFDFNFVDLEIKKDIAFITINRPEAMNALNETVVGQLADRFSEAESNPDVRAVVFQGAGKAFVAGADIRYFVNKITSDRIQDIYNFTRKGQDVLLDIENSDKLTIALLDGLSLGGGSELALACQAIIATPAASMGFPETGIGIFPGMGGMARMGKITGPELTKYYVFTGKVISAEDALAMGLITRLVSPAEVEAAIEEQIKDGKPDKYREQRLPDKFQPFVAMCTKANTQNLLSGLPPAGATEELAAKTAKIIGNKAPIALKLVSEIIDQQVDKSVSEAVDIEMEYLNQIFSTADALEGLSTMGRKKPEFRGA